MYLKYVQSILYFKYINTFFHCYFVIAAMKQSIMCPAMFYDSHKIIA